MLNPLNPGTHEPTLKSSLAPLRPVLIVDDEEQDLYSFEMSLKSSGINHLITLNDSRKVLPLLSEQEIEILLLDLTMPHVSGEDLLIQVQEKFPNLPVLIVTGNNEIEKAIHCMKNGAFDYIVKPVHKERLVSSVRIALELSEIKRENIALKTSLLIEKNISPNFSGILTSNRKMHSIFQYISAIAESPYPVLITGETGVGKEMIAQAIHQESKRKGKFIPLNISGLDPNIFSDTLFGHKKGAFTGAETVRKGMIEIAENGSLFLDEIGDLNLECQIKLLRLIQEGEFLPLGSDMPQKSNVRIIAATNKNLKDLIEKNQFRQDLYFRLSPHNINIPPLRERPDDIPLLTNHFFEETCRNLNRKIPELPKGLYPLLASHPFPGNIRELKSLIYDLVSSQNSGDFSLSTLRESLKSLKKEPSQKVLLQQIEFPEKLPTFREMEDLLLNEALKRSNGNQTIAASLLGISRQAISKRLKKNGDSAEKSTDHKWSTRSISEASSDSA